MGGGLFNETDKQTTSEASYLSMAQFLGFSPRKNIAKEKEMASKMELEVELKSSADKFWGAISDSDTLLVKLFPEHFVSIEIIEGDGKSAGSVRLVKHGEGNVA